MKEKNKNKKWIIIAVVVLLIFVIGATFAYFQAQQDKYKSSSADLITKTTDSFTFEISNDISINASLSNFSEGTGNLSSSATAKAILRANNYTGNAKYFYNLVIDIASNDFIYTTSSSNPELILTITDPTGKIITSLDGLNYVTSGDVSGFDVTTKTGQILIAENYVISTTSTITQTWNITLTFVNLNSDQQANTGKSFNAKLKMNKENPTLLADHIISLYSEDGVNNLYYHDGMGSYTNSNLEANDNSYRYTGAEATVTSSSGYVDLNSVIASFWGSSTDSCVYRLNYNADLEFDNYFKALEQAQKDGYVENLMNNFVCFGSDEEICPDENLYRIIGVFQDGNEYNVKLISTDYATEGMMGMPSLDGYSFSKTSPDSRVYKGSQYEVSTFNWGPSVDGMGHYVWSYDECVNHVSSQFPELTCPSEGLEFNLQNDWEESYMRRRYLYNYYNSYSNKWQNLIKNSEWSVGGWEHYSSNTINETYRREVWLEYYEHSFYHINERIDENVGLMYITDYMYGATPFYWDKQFQEYNQSVYDNWLYLGAEEWTITRSYYHGNEDLFNALNSGGNPAYVLVDGVYTISGDGSIHDEANNSASQGFPVRPTFYLFSNVIYLGGSGTASDPMRIK